MKKILLISLFTALFLCLNSCSGQLPGNRITYLIEDTIENKDDNFVYPEYLGMRIELTEVITKIEYTYTDKINDVIKEMDPICQKYNNGLLTGDVKLMGSIKINGSHVLHTWHLTAAK